MSHQKAGKVVTISLRRALFKQPEVSIAIGLVLDKLILAALSTPLMGGTMGRSCYI